MIVRRDEGEVMGVTSRCAIALAALLSVLCAGAYAQETPAGKPVMPRYQYGAMVSAPEMQAVYDSLRWRQEMRLDNALSSYAPRGNAIGGIPESREGGILQWKGGGLYGNSGEMPMTGLLYKRSAVVFAVQHTGNFTFTAGLSAGKYALPADGRLTALGLGAVQNQFGVGGSMTYDFSPNLSATVFGQYVSNPFYYSMAAFPFVPTSSYGGYLTLHNDKVGIDLGVNRRYDPFSHRWITDPIVRPSFKLGKMKMEIDTGPLIKESILKLMGRKPRPGAIIAPSW